MKRYGTILFLVLMAVAHAQTVPVKRRTAAVLTAATPTFSPSTGSSIASGSTVTITPQSACNSHTYWATHTPPTTGDTQAVSIAASGSGSVTYYAKTSSCPGFTDSAVGTATYTLTAPVLISDSFTAANGTAINGRTLDCLAGGSCSGPVTWSLDAGSGGTGLTIQSNAMSSDLAAGMRASVAGFTPANGDYTVSARLVTIAAAYPMICTRGSTAFDAYCVYASPGGYQLIRWDASTRVDLGAITGSWTTGDVISLQATGTAPVALSVKQNGSPLISFSDSSANKKTANGVPRIGSLDFGFVIDDFLVQ